MTNRFNDKRFMKAYAVDKGVLRPCLIQLDHVTRISTSSPLTCTNTRRKVQGAYVTFTSSQPPYLIGLHEEEREFIKAFLT